MLIAREETSALSRRCFRFDTEEQAVAMANDTEFGLAAYFYTENSKRMWRVCASHWSMAWSVITPDSFRTKFAPFGGMKQSGIGREGSKYGIDEYLEIKYFCTSVG